ncbi:MAG: galactokinase family protein [Erysipelotrichaceae bacterium]|nr:galactokinase family protein [Erysipelotrichaceae bacterium]MDD3810297.1 galactokinase family protein [Erysipelotrichaceae bacterium]
MEKASYLIEQFKNDKLKQRIEDIYVDEKMYEKMKNRYVAAITKFISLYGDQDVEIYSTPGRSEVCGNHTDHQNGEVLATAVNMDIIAVVAKNDHEVKITDAYYLKAIPIDDLEIKNNELETSEALIRGTLARFKQLGYAIGGFNAFMTSDVPAGSGLSSSAAFEVMIGTILSGLYNDMKIDPVEIAKIGQYSERNYFGKPCGLMDQCACSIGGLIHIDFQNKDNPKVNKIDTDFSKFKHSLCIVDVNASHADLTGEYAAIPQEMASVANCFGKDLLREVDSADFYNQISAIRQKTSDRAVLRALHFFNENIRVEQAVEALTNGEFDSFKKIIAASGNSSFKYLQNVYSNNDYSHQAVSIALGLSEVILGSHGVCRVHGGGFAGTIQCFVEDDYVATYKKEIEKHFGEGKCHVLKIRPYGGIKAI